MINKYSQYILDSLAEGVFVVDKEFMKEAEHLYFI